MGTPGITDPFLSELDTAIAGGTPTSTDPIYPPSDFETISASGTILGWNDPLSQASSPIAGTLTTEDILTDPGLPGEGGTMGVSEEELGIVPAGKNWIFKGPFSSSDYQRYQRQDLLEGPFGAKSNSSTYPSKYGVRSRFPRSSPKYTRYFPRTNHEFVETTARMYIAVANPKAFISGVGANNKELSSIAQVLVGNSKEASSGKGYIDFLLQQASHSLNEKVQVIETLSDNYVAFFFGQSAPVFKYSGVLLNSFQDDWAVNMLRMFQSISRGSQLARRGVLFYLKYDSYVMSGSLLNFNWALSGDNEMIVPFSFDMLIRKIHIVYNGLEGPTDIMLDSTVDPSTVSFWPVGYNPGESGKATLHGKIWDDVGGQSPFGEVTTGPIGTTKENTPEGGDKPVVAEAPTPTAAELAQQEKDRYNAYLNKAAYGPPSSPKPISY